MDIGFELRHAREARGISLIELSRRTKIRIATLHAIDANDFDALPGGVFTRGFLQAYAREVGANPDAVAQEYSTRLKEEAAAAERSRTAATQVEVDETDPMAAVNRDDGVRASTVVMWVAVSAAVFIAVDRWQASDPSEAAPPPAVEQTAPVATTGAADPPPAPVAAPRTPLRMELRSVGPCWLEATADGARVIYRLMSAGEHETIDAREDIVLRIGDPASLQLLINGAPARPLGTAATPVTVRITPGNFKEFL